MNSITITETSVIPFSKEHPHPYIERENDYGKYVQFRLAEKRYKKRDNIWLMTCEGAVMEQFLALNVKIGSNLFILGEEETYMDIQLKKESKYVKVYNVKYGDIRDSNSTHHNVNATAIPPKPEDVIDEQEIFIKSIDLK